MTEPDRYLFGMARGDITPSTGTPLGGYAFRGEHASEGTYLPLEVVATYIADGSTELIMVVADWLGFYDRAERARSRIAQSTGIPLDQVVVLGTHTHCGPAIRKSDAAWYGHVDEDHLSAAIEQMALVAEAARSKAVWCRLALRQGSCAIAMSRRRPDPERPGRVLRGSHPYPDGITDDAVPVLTAYADDTDRPVGLVLSYACHPTARAGLLAGGDYPGFARQALRQSFPEAEVAFWQGCAGDQNPRPLDSTDTFGGRTVPQVRELGEELARAAEEAISAGEETALRGTLGVRHKEVTLEAEPVTESLINYAADHDSPQLDAWARRAREHIAGAGDALSSSVSFGIVVVTFGEALIMVGMAGEMTVEHGLLLRQRLGGQFEAVVPVGYVDAMVGYVPSRRQSAEGGYEVLDSNLLYGRTGPFVPETETVIHEAVASLVRGES